jgi:Phage tail tube protein
MATAVSGNASAIGLARETTFGTASAAANYNLILITGDTIKGDQAQDQSQLLASDPNPRDPLNKRQNAGGDITTYPNLSSIPYLCEFMLGSRVTTGTTPTIIHTSKLTSGVFPFFTYDASVAFAAATKWKRQVSSHMVKTNIAWAVDSFLTFKHTTLGCNVVNPYPSTVLHATIQDWTTQDVFDHMMITAALVKVGGTPCATISGGEVTIDMMLNPNHYAVGQNGFRRSIPRKRAAVTGKISTILEDEVLLALALAGTMTSVDITWTMGANMTFQLVLPRVKLKRTDPEIKDGPLTVDFDFTASRDTTAATSVYTVCTNNVAAAIYDL